MTPNTKCSQRRSIISLASGVSRREKCGRQAGKENASPCKNITAPHHRAQSSCANTVTDCQPHRQIRAAPVKPRFRIRVATLRNQGTAIHEEDCTAFSQKMVPERGLDPPRPCDH